ncbi:bacterial Ig-like domain-containing protein [Bifidobacterium sp. CP2]|uniref:bacterial Ig-like domain-containing protein n=1 Tax=Bifidobacterium sp. CP2 TaxID=2809025 RepID=UPI001BDBEAB5|nr:bacterial Ig-like domain-containing protein [Bifidobacterium sp. CP2]MBT1181774.1 bacterial Ig-like domain-containing protein [Bifidobacterium sp. CP2]
MKRLHAEPTPSAGGGALRKVMAAIAGAAMMLTIVPFAASTAVADEADYTDNGTIHTYAATGAGTDVLGDKTATPDVASTKYQVKANGTDVETVQYNAAANYPGSDAGYHFDIARFASNSRTPKLEVTLPNVEINTVHIYPEHYYEGKYTVSPDKHTLTFQMEQSLNYVIVMINGDATNKDGKPYLAVINDPLEEDAAKPDAAAGSSADEKAWGYNETTGVVNFQTFAKKYLESDAGTKLPDGKTTVKKQEAIASHHTSLWNDGKGTEIGGQTAKGVTSEGKIVDASTVDVAYPNQRKMSADDSTYALQAAFDFIENKGATLNTLYLPDGTYTWGGLDVNGVDGSKVKGGTLKIYTEDGALMLNRVQAYREAQEPAIGIWNSKNIEISGRGIYDGNGVKNYSGRNKGASGDRNDAYMSQHQAGVMVVHSSDITFNDTYMRGAKQWNWETHTAKNVTFNNIKGLTPYGMPWGDGMDFASGQNLTVNGALTLGNDDTFASGHYNPGRWYQYDKPDLYNKMFGFNGSNPNIQGYDDSVGAYDAFVASHGVDNDDWDDADSHDITLNNTLGWSVAAGNGIRLGHEAHGYQLKNYTFNNFNSLGFQGGGRAITIQNHTDIYPRYENIVITNSSFDTSRVGRNFDINGADGSSKVTVKAADQAANGYRPNPDGSGKDYNVDRTPIGNVTIDKVWFSNANARFDLTNTTNATVNDLYVGGKQVQYSNQVTFAQNAVGKLAYTYTDADGKTQDVKQNTVPTFTSPDSDSITVKAGEQLSLDVTVNDPDVANGDNVKITTSDLSGLKGASFDPAANKLTWTPGEDQIGEYPVTFTAADAGAQAGDYDPTVKTVTIKVISAKSEVKTVTSSADAYVASWKTNKNNDYSTNPGNKNTAGYFAVRNADGKGLLGEQNKSTSTGDGTDVKLGFVQFDLSQFKDKEPSLAQLKLTLIGRRYDTANRADEQIVVAPVNADKRLDGTAFDGTLAGMTWNTRPNFDAAADATTTSAAFDNGNNEVRSDVPGSVDGATVTVDVTKAVQDALKAGKTTLTLAVGGKYANDELYFVNTKGAAEGTYGAKAAQAPTLDVTLPVESGATKPNPPATDVPTTDKVPTYTKFEAIADPGTKDKNYFQPLWYAKDSADSTSGEHIQAHGGQIVPVQENGKTVYYWYGEDRSSGYYNSHGVHVYRSEDLMNWTDQGVALRSIYYDDELKDDSYFTDLYGLKDASGKFDEAKAKKLAFYLNTNTDENGDGVKDNENAIFERPKVLYNAKTKKYVMWWHADGTKTVESTANYERSLAGVAVSDSPTGPFKMVGAYRLPNRQDYKTGHKNAVPGGSRDMTVFQDDDGTAYVIYSSEENRTLYIAKLNDDYTNVVKTTKDTSKVADVDLQYSESGEYPYTLADGGDGAPVSGQDFVIVKDRGMLEAPAMFKNNGKYYIVASGATGWAPNKQTYYTSDTVFGTWIRGVQADDQYENTAFSALPEGADGLLSVGDTRGSTFGSQTASVFKVAENKFIYIGDRWNSGKASSTYVWLPISVNQTTGALTMQNPATQDASAYGDGWGLNYWDETADNPLNLASITIDGKAVANFDGGTTTYGVNIGAWGKAPTVDAVAANPDDVTVTTDVNTARAIITVTSKTDPTKTRVYTVRFTTTTEGCKAVSDPWKTTSWGNAGTFCQGETDGSFLVTDASNNGAWTNKDNLSAIYQSAKLGVGDSIETTITSSQAGNNTDPRAGIIVRNDLSAAGQGKAHGYALLAASPNGAYFQTDSNNNGFIDKQSDTVAEAASSVDTPVSLKLVRNSATELEGFTRLAGSDEWKSLGKVTLGDDAAERLDVGVFATSNNAKGDYTVIFDGTAVTAKGEPEPEPTVTGITVDATGADTEYTVGDTFSADGLKVAKTMSSGDPVEVGSDGYTVSAVDPDGKAVDLTKPFAEALGGKKVTVTVALKDDATKTASYEVTVNAKPVTPPATVTVKSIAVTSGPTKTEYTVGDAFSADGLKVTATLSDGKTRELKLGEDYVLTGFDSSKASDAVKVTVTYTGKDAAEGLKPVTFTVKVKAKAAGEGGNSGQGQGQGGNSGQGGQGGSGNGSGNGANGAKKPGAGLSKTGASVTVAVLAAVALLGAGVALTVLRRRRDA